ncbi:MAG TPA: twin-arginine translocase TatA/TatE family subunit [Sphingobacteriaceae bacterium]|nr:twin-arginine translocase TatA/TatE family subunit [Sphingobacteriaceae bacterium]
MSSLFLFLNLGTQETILIVFAILIMFGGKKLPELARGLGKGIREFKDASDGVKQEIHDQMDEIHNKSLPAPAKIEAPVQSEPVVKQKTDHL